MKLIIGDSKVGRRFNVWQISREYSVKGHPAVFPTQLAYNHILSWSNEGDLVLDPFMGSGTTAVAAIKAKRHYIGFELNSNYFELANWRIEQEHS